MAAAQEEENVHDAQQPQRPTRYAIVPEDDEEQLIEEDDATGNSINDEIITMESSSRASPCQVVFTYITAAISAVLLTFFSPGTRLWISTNNNTIDGDDDVTVNTACLTQLVTILLLTLLSLALVQGSDPGYLDVDIVNSICQEDGLSLLGYDDEESPKSEDIVEEEVVSLDDRTPGGLIRRSPSRGSNSTTSSENGTAAGAAAAHDGSTSALSQDPPIGLHHVGHDEVDDKNNASSCSPLYFQGTTRRKVCQTCQFAPPLRAHHCKICNRCVATFDHHCTFIGTCIGERNHCRFWWFLTIQLGGFLVCSSIVGSSHLGVTSLMKQQQFSSLDATAIIVVVVAKLYLYPLTLIAFLVWIVHTVFAIANVTTFESGKGPTHIDYLKGTQETDFPFSRGLDGNLRMFCCQRDDGACRRCYPGQQQRHWKPIVWKAPGKIIRDSEDWWEHPWQNKYWSCC